MTCYKRDDEICAIFRNIIDKILDQIQYDVSYSNPNPYNTKEMEDLRQRICNHRMYPIFMRTFKVSRYNVSRKIIEEDFNIFQAIFSSLDDALSFMRQYNLKIFAYRIECNICANHIEYYRYYNQLTDIYKSISIDDKKDFVLALTKNIIDFSRLTIEYAIKQQDLVKSYIKEELLKIDPTIREINGYCLLGNKKTIVYDNSFVVGHIDSSFTKDGDPTNLPIMRTNMQIYPSLYMAQKYISSLHTDRIMENDQYEQELGEVYKEYENIILNAPNDSDITKIIQNFWQNFNGRLFVVHPPIMYKFIDQFFEIVQEDGSRRIILAYNTNKITKSHLNQKTYSNKMFKVIDVTDSLLITLLRFLTPQYINKYYTSNTDRYISYCADFKKTEKLRRLIDSSIDSPEYKKISDMIVLICNDEHVYRPYQVYRSYIEKCKNMKNLILDILPLSINMVQNINKIKGNIYVDMICRDILNNEANTLHIESELAQVISDALNQTDWWQKTQKEHDLSNVKICIKLFADPYHNTLDVWNDKSCANISQDIFYTKRVANYALNESSLVLYLKDLITYPVDCLSRPLCKELTSAWLKNHSLFINIGTQNIYYDDLDLSMSFLTSFYFIDINTGQAIWLDDKDCCKSIFNTIANIVYRWSKNDMKDLPELDRICAKYVTKDHHILFITRLAFLLWKISTMTENDVKNVIPALNDSSIIQKTSFEDYLTQLKYYDDNRHESISNAYLAKMM